MNTAGFNRAITVTGMTNVLKRLNQEYAELKGSTLQGLIRASIVVRRAMDKEEPKIPVKYGNLRASFFIVASNGRLVRGGNPVFKTESGEAAAKLVQDHASTVAEAQALITNAPMPVVAFGFTASYGFFVHEMVDAVNWNRTGSGAKFLEQALINNEAEMLKVIKESTNVWGNNGAGNFIKRVTGY